MKTAIITPYYQEEASVLKRCIQSVRTQTVAADHILVADGFPQAWVAGEGLRQVVLDRAHGDYGDSPRAIGFLLAVREQYDAIQFLDADNVLAENHVETMWTVQQSENLDVVIASRIFLRPDGSRIPFSFPEDDQGLHVDTSCYFFTRASFAMGLRWGLVPSQLSCIGDRVFLAMLRQSNLRMLRVIEPTVGYTALWKDIYEAVGETPPAGAKTLDAALQKMAQWWRGLTAVEQGAIQNMLGVTITV